MENVVIMATTGDLPPTAGGTAMDTDMRPMKRERSGSLGKVSDMTLPNLKTFTRMFGGPFQPFDRDHNTLGHTLSDSMDDLYDSSSQISDSGFSDASHEQPHSPGIVGENAFTFKRNASSDNLLRGVGELQPTPADLPPHSPAHRRQHTDTDIEMKAPAPGSILPPSPLHRPTQDAIREKAQKKKLSHSMIWNWVKSQQVRIDENSALDSNDPLLDSDERYFGFRGRTKVTLRDINAMGPSGW